MGQIAAAARCLWAQLLLHEGVKISSCAPAASSRFLEAALFLLIPFLLLRPRRPPAALEQRRRRRGTRGSRQPPPSRPAH